MLLLLKRYRELLVVGALLLLPFASFLSNGRKGRELNLLDRAVVNVTSPLASALTWTIEGVGSLWRGYVWLRGVQVENEALQKESLRLRDEVHALEEARAENERLKRLLAYVDGTGGQPVAARVVGINPDRREPSVRINRGIESGVQRGMPVVTPEGVVGQVMRATGHSADVMLYTSPHSRIGVRVQRTRARAMAIPDGPGGTLKLEFALRTEDLAEGDLVITSGTDGVFPPGLVMGRLTQVERKSHGTFQAAQIIPAVNTTRLEEVLVLPAVPRPPPPGAPLGVLP